MGEESNPSSSQPFSSNFMRGSQADLKRPTQSSETNMPCVKGHRIAHCSDREKSPGHAAYANRSERSGKGQLVAVGGGR